jgi:hypothetical protein
MLNLKLKANNIQRFEQLKKTLQDLKDKVDRAKVQEEYLLKQLKDELDCDSLEEGLELLNILKNEKKEYDDKIESKIDSLMESLKKEGLI